MTRQLDHSGCTWYCDFSTNGCEHSRAWLASRPVHMQTSASGVRCGAPMRDDEHEDGWDMGSATTNDKLVTCTRCKRSGRTVAHERGSRSGECGGARMTALTCRVFALCDREATTSIPHPILGSVPACQPCADKMQRIERDTRCIHGDPISRCHGERDDYRHEV